MEKYAFNKEIGAGSFGKVFLIESKQIGIQYVLKQIDMRKLEKKQIQWTSKEVEVLSKLNHHHVVRYKESYEKDNHLSIIMEYCENGDLHSKIKEKRVKNECFTDNEILDYFVQICVALEYIHGQKILHRDLKTKNIFLTKGNLIKLGDFGVAKILENSFELANTCIGSPYYISPEICENKPYNRKSDIWALGCVLYELSTLKYAFVAKNMKLLITKITSGTFNPVSVNVNIQIRSLLINLLKPNPKDRPTASEILVKPFLMKFRFKCEKCKANLTKKRSTSGDRLKNVKLNNQSRILSSSWTKLNDLTRNNKFNITTPETKYGGTFLNNKFRYFKKWHPLSAVEGSIDLCKVPTRQTDSHIGFPFNVTKYILKNDSLEQANKHEESETMARKVKWQPTKIVKLKKVDSEYYDLIAESKGNLTCNIDDTENEGQTGRTPHFEENHTSQDVMREESENMAHEHDTGNEDTRELISEIGIGPEASRNNEEGQQSDVEISEFRRKWQADTLEKQQLISILGEAELIDVTSMRSSAIESFGINQLKLTVDDLLKFDPTEMSDDILKPEQIEANHQIGDQSSNTDYLMLLKDEICEIKRKFEANNKKYDVQDLMRLTENSKKILKGELKQKYSEVDTFREERYMSDKSVYYDMELQRMHLEKTVGLNVFVKTYRKMIDILNGNILPLTETSEESVLSGTETYIIPKDKNTEDLKKRIERTWLMIIDAFGTKKEYIPDIWECAVRESVYY